MNKLDEIQERLEAAFSRLRFTEKGHRYTLVDKNLQTKFLPSTTKQLKNFYIEFDNNIAFHVAGKGKYEGMSGIDVQLAWEDNRVKAAQFGTDVHTFGEYYAISDRPKPRNNHELGIVQWWMDMPEHLHLAATELRMYNEEIGYAGTADIILYNELDDSLIIADYKTNKDLFKKYGSRTMLEPFSDLEDHSYNKYQLQFSHYQMCLEEKGFKVSRRLLVHLIEDKDNMKFYKNYDTDDYTIDLKEYYGNNTTAHIRPQKFNPSAFRR